MPLKSILLKIHRISFLLIPLRNRRMAERGFAYHTLHQGTANKLQDYYNYTYRTHLIF